MTASLTPRQDAVLAMMASPPDDPRRARIHRIVAAVMFEYAKMGDEDEDFVVVMSSMTECFASAIKSVCTTVAEGDAEECAHLEGVLLRSIERVLGESPVSSAKQSFSVEAGRA